jgi:hypothetical protein
MPHERTAPLRALGSVQRRTTLRAAAAGLCLTALFAGRPARAAVLAEDDLADTSTEMGVIARNFDFLFAGATLRPPFTAADESPAATGILDLRSYASYRSTHLRLVWHQTNLLELRSFAALGTLDFGRGIPPPRMFPLYAESDRGNLTLRTEADWLYAAYAAGMVTITLGRQPVTLGHSQLFHPWDIVASFSLTEVDTEYKPGADAARVDVSLSPKTTLALIASGGSLERAHRVALDAQGSTLVMSLKQGFSKGEFGGLLAFAHGDIVAGYSALVSLRKLDLYTEISATWTGPSSLSSPAVAGRKAAVPRLLAGASLHPASHLTLVPEAYYEGFGAKREQDYLAVAASERVRVGEQVVFGRLYGGAALDWEAHPLLHVISSAFVNALDPSALASALAYYDAAPNTRLTLGAYVPFGAAPTATTTGSGPLVTTKSEYGLFPYFGFAEIRVVL